MLKKLSIAILAFTMVLAMAACTPSDQTTDTSSETETEANEQVAGGWELYNNDANAYPLPEKVQNAFEKASESFTGDDLKPVSFLASQVVSGTNYMILCETAANGAKPAISYHVAIVYEDLEGNAEITSVKDFDLLSYVEGGSTEISNEKLAGGWEITEDIGTVVMPQEARDVFDRVATDLDGNKLEAMALLGTQVVSGTNYAFLCHSTLQTEDTVNGIQVVTVYADLNGDVQITNISTVDPADLTE